jgi:hypothetical protein
MSTTDGPASRERLSPIATALPYLLSRLSFLAGIVFGAWTTSPWVFLVGSALGLLLAGLDRLITRAARFDDEIDLVLAQLRRTEDPTLDA